MRFLVPLKHREIDNPQRGKHILVAQPQTVAHFKAQLVEGFARGHGLAGKYQQQVARAGFATLGPCFQVFIAVELAHAALYRPVGFDFHPHKAFGTYLRTFHEVGQFIYLLAGICGATRGADGTHVFGTVKHAEVVSFGQVLEFHECHAETDIRLVASVILHSIGPRHARERFGEINVAHILEYVFYKSLEHLQHIFLLNERHFAVDLRELGLTVGTQVFIAEALGYLEITVETCHHEQLLVELRRLREGIKLSRIHARRHHEVAGTLGGRFHQDRSFHFKEAIVVEILA